MDTRRPIILYVRATGTDWAVDSAFGHLGRIGHLGAFGRMLLRRRLASLGIEVDADDIELRIV